MYYVARKLHFADGGVMCMQVVQVTDGVVQACFPFDGERQSMLWVEEAFLSPLPEAVVLKDILSVAEGARRDGSFYLYSCESCELFSPLKRLE